MYPTPDEAAVLETVEAFMVKTMARYDPSHDALHGEFDERREKREENTILILRLLCHTYSPTRPQNCTTTGLRSIGFLSLARSPCD